MKQLIKKIKLRLRRYKFLLLWKSEFINFPKNEIKAGEELELGNIKKPLVLVPHADDELIGNSTILKYFGKELDVYYFQFLGNNYNDSNKKLRSNELNKIQQKYGFNLYNSNSYTDYSDLEALFADGNHTDIFLPFPLDWHTEHIKISTILQPIIEKLGLEKQINLYFYHISVPLPADVPFYYVALSKEELQEKQSTFSNLYISQYNTPIRRLNYQNQINALGSSYYAKENFAHLRYDQWISFLEYVDKNFVSKIKPLIFSIDNMKQTRQLAHKIYQDWINIKTQ